MRHSCWPPFQRRAFSLKAAYSKQKDRGRWHGWRARGPRERCGLTWRTCWRSDKERPAGSGQFLEESPCLGRTNRFSSPCAAGGPTLTTSVVESGGLVLGLGSFPLRLRQIDAILSKLWRSLREPVPALGPYSSSSSSSSSSSTLSSSSIAESITSIAC